ncbi:unnamed protein product [Bursaphelenchus okinawaensis]|uniref:Uncharacterized protein n=1 Tax=Bursaphelenchus okinawaensis TaxID=465554 RepID=A0A811L6H0_9BILA|nr:unnamed protein product [Bursaphelenchus okinawaensis]CAG9117432.1 unnamed protein product [Bursaphelenchus okinawaensis]
MLADEDGLNASQMPIICLMEWSSPRCKEHAFDVPAPKFAPNFKFPTTPTTRRLTHGLRNANKPEKDVQILERGTTVAPSSGEKNESFFTPIVPKAFKSKNKSTSRTTPGPSSSKETQVVVTSATRHRPSDSAQQRRTVKPTGKTKMEQRPASQSSYNGDDDYSEDEDAAREDEGYDEKGYDEERGDDEEMEDVDDLNRLKTPATYAPYARAQLVNSGPNELDSLWTDLSHAVDFKSGGSWRRPVTASTTTPLPSTTSSTSTTTLATTTKRIATTMFVSTTRWLETTTQASRQKLRTIQTESTTTIPLYAVRPTTPMGDLLTTTKAPIVTTDFPRTALISIASVSVIIIIAFVVFCVFRCRQSAPPSESTYPMAYSGTKQASMGMGNVMLGSGNHGYTPIPSEMSPPAAQHTQQFAGMSPRVNYESMNGAQTLPSAMRRPNGLTNGGPHPNGMGYQTIGQHVVNQNGQTSPARTNGNANGAANGGSRTWGRDRKKDFKEWYV